ncbi:oligopeptide ABC transporter substrate-binding protein [Longirhabdus pacifica]|uniref:oligopeptide ABC transporter substrate-binding protein n=1 Tax=Longirhabdus pacifica TaxID=2305227 RepID=UPI001008867E|nr:oligopeptide ABC transporter substrate-binding protein [Longirhabdus pacifica]
MKKSMLMLLSLLLVFSLFLAACGSENDNESGNDSNETEEPATDENNGEDAAEGEIPEPQEGGTITVGAGAEFNGILDINFYSNASDAEILNFTTDNLISFNEQMQPQPNIATWEEKDDTTLAFTFKEGVKWHNGDELTVNDWVFALETLANKEYPGDRWVNVANIKGAEAFREGNADSIEGINVIDDYNIEITFEKPEVNNLINLWTYPLHKASFENIPVADMLDSELVRTAPISTGPFKVKNVVQGEFVELERFDDYWQGKPYLDGVNIKVFDDSLVTGALESGEIDFVNAHPSKMEEIKGMNSVKLEILPGLSYSYIGFKLGKWDAENTLNVTDETNKYGDVRLRQAMSYAINRQLIIDEFFSGLGLPIYTPSSSSHWITADNADLIEYDYNPEKAMELLDEAGFIDVDGDGFREDPEGNVFTIKFGHYSGREQFELRSQLMMQYWQEVGLNAEYATGQLVDANLYYDMLENDDPEIEVYFGGWVTGVDPDPYPTWGSGALWNMTRWVDDKHEQLLLDAKDFNVVGSDQDARKELYVEWQQLFNEQLPAIPLFEYQELFAINQNLFGVYLDVVGPDKEHEWYIAQ